MEYKSSTWSFINISTDLFYPATYSGPENYLVLNTPDNCMAIEGKYDHLSQKWDPTTETVVDYQPPKPDDDQWQTWSWDVNIKRWISTPTLLDYKRSARQRMARSWNEAKTQGVTFGTKTAPTDADSWTRYLAIKEMAADGGWVDVPIPLADGTFELMTQAKMVTLWGALKTMERTLLNKLKDKVGLINAATTKEEIDAITW
jgi:hypothetical protein